ncbi:DUF4974 domain-containing protein [Chitinophaga silvatica]|uniref:DUF4974 domain-containing protein n=1 Tax=Chitinophaga silvatica TaxID=2282649 RepID=A0A3E1Y5I4_9BACT|nr:FecR family protein [Chitinophaga silvatica]RFS19993.1 DUF4974 domain-containing protein [Chitinophaga silvatica]
MEKKLYDTVTELIADESFIRYCIAQETDEVIEWENWMIQHPEKRPLVLEAKSFLLQLNTALDEEIQIQQALDEFKILFDHTHTTEFTTSKQGKRKWVLASSIFAAVLTILGVIYYKQTNIHYHAANPTIIHNDQALRKNIKLVDGSTVVLAKNSTIYIDPDYNSSNRSIRLDGEAWFNVVTNNKQPFTVGTSQLLTTVLGTNFMVRAFSKEKDEQVTLLSGKVKVKSTGSARETILTPGETVSQDLSKSIIDTLALSQWTTGKLQFHHIPIAAALKQIAVWHHVKIEILGTPSVEATMNAKFTNESLPEMLDLLSFSAGFSYRVQSDTIFIQF